MRVFSFIAAPLVLLRPEPSSFNLGEEGCFAYLLKGYDLVGGVQACSMSQLHSPIVPAYLAY